MESTTITKQFSSAFDSKNETHVKWLKSLHDATQNEKSVDKVLAVNPFGIKPTKKDMLEWVHIQFILAMKYAMNVLDGDAWVPVQKS
jgi:hypothetical protein